MHSRNKIRLYYPELGIETAQKQENDSYALWDFYGKATSPQLRDYDVSLKILFPKTTANWKEKGWTYTVFSHLAVFWQQNA